MKAYAGLSLVLVTALSASTALGQAKPADARAASVALFREAERLATSGNIVEACRKYGESYSLDPQLEAVLKWADCLEHGGKWASAYLAFRDAAELAQRANDVRAPTAEARAQALRPRLSYVTIEVSREHTLPALSVERDGFRLGSSAWGVPMPVDPGSHTVRVNAYGYREWRTTFEIATDGAAPYIEVPLLEKLAEGAAMGQPEAPVALVAPPVVPAPVAAAPVAAAPAALVSSSAPLADAPAPKKAAPFRWNAARIAGVALGGSGLVAVGAGFYFMAKTRSTLSDRDAICPSGKDCEPGTNKRLEQMTSNAVASQRSEVVFFALGATAVTAGVALWLASGYEAKPARRAAIVVPIVTYSGAGLALHGSL